MPAGAETGNIPTMMDDKPPEVQIPEPGSAGSSRSERCSSVPPELTPELPPISPPRLAAAPALKEKGGNLGILWAVGIIAGIVILIAVFGSGGGSGNSTPTYSGSGSPGGSGGFVPPAIPNQPVVGNPNPRSQFDRSQPVNVSRSQTPPANHTFRVSSTVSAELDREKRAIDDEKAKAARIEAVLEESNTAVEEKKAELDELDTNLETLSRQIDRERIYMDRTSQYDIDSFNLKVNRYNSALRNRKAEAEVFNDMVDTHNTIVQQLKAQNRRVNELVDNYNAKLPRYGR